MKKASAAKTIKPKPRKKKGASRTQTRSAPGPVKLSDGEWKKHQFTLTKIPKGVACELMAKSQKTTGEWCSTYGLPLKGEVVDLQGLLTWFADRLAKYGRFEKTLEEDADEEGNDDGDGDNLQAAYIKAKTIKAKEDTLMQRVKREKLQEELVVKEIVHASLARLSDRLRAAGERGRARYGEDFVELFSELQAGFALDIDQACSSDDASAAVEPVEPAA